LRKGREVFFLDKRRVRETFYLWFMPFNLVNLEKFR
jgi:hypothetical protein